MFHPPSRSQLSELSGLYGFLLDSVCENHFQIKSSLDKDTSKNFVLIGSPKDISYLKEENTVNLLKIFEKDFFSEKIKVYEVSF